MITHQCTECGIEKPATRAFFYAEPRNKCGLRSNCKECVKTRSRAWGRAHPAENAARAKAWKKANWERERERQEAWKAKNPQKHRAAIARWHAANKHRQRLASKRYWRRHRKRLLEKGRAWRGANKDIVRVQWRLRRARKLGAEGNHTAADVSAIRKRQRNKCAYCRVDLGKGGHLDHIIALARGGSNWPRNLQWLCAPCNQEKLAKDPIDYAQSRGLLL